MKELSLSSLYGAIEDIVSIEPIFCSDGGIYFVAETETVVGGSATGQDNYFFFGGKKAYDYILCCVDIETGELTQIHSWHRE